MPAETLTYSEINQKLESVEKWLAKFYPTNTSNRFTVIRKEITKASKAFQSQTLKQHIRQEGPDGTTRLIISLTESEPLIRIYEAFQFETDQDFASKVKTIFGGPHLPWNETTSSSKSRNFLFELDLAARCKSTKCSIINFDDITIEFQKRLVNIQCKRLQSERKTEERIREAQKQLLSQFERHDNSRGIIAIDVGKILGLDRNVLRRRTADEADRDVAVLLRKFAHIHRKHWKLAGIDPRILGILLFTRYILWSNEKPNLFAASKMHFNAFPLPVNQSLVEATDANLAKNLMDTLS